MPLFAISLPFVDYTLRCKGVHENCPDGGIRRDAVYFGFGYAFIKVDKTGDIPKTSIEFKYNLQDEE